MIVQTLDTALDDTRNVTTPPAERCDPIVNAVETPPKGSDPLPNGPTPITNRQNSSANQFRSSADHHRSTATARNTVPNRLPPTGRAPASISLGLKSRGQP